jgi:hypothetical protein
MTEIRSDFNAALDVYSTCDACSAFESVRSVLRLGSVGKTAGYGKIQKDPGSTRLHMLLGTDAQKQLQSRILSIEAWISNLLLFQMNRS